MIDKAEKIYSDGKKNLELLLREKAYSEVKQNLKNKGIAIDTIDDEDIENALKNQKNGNKIEIASPNIDKRTPLREVHIVVNAKNPIKAKNIKKLDIASPTIDHKSMIRKINVELKLKKGVKIK